MSAGAATRQWSSSRLRSRPSPAASRGSRCDDSLTVAAEAGLRVAAPPDRRIFGYARSSMISRTRYVTEAGPLHAAEPVGWGWSAQEPRRSAAPARRRWAWTVLAAAACSVAAVALAGF